ncbi:MAG TPA: glycogen debranching N-terminal domain-containing protein [Propionibacteriaceae bacterium]|nr:glycogen debranching N-terminal domain-containing protein [Propionibacteriaceae bacterium]
MEQPYLHELSVTLAAPQQCWSRRDGQIVESAVQGVYCADVRVASTVTLAADAHVNEHIGTIEPGGGTARYDTVWRTPDLGADPALVCRRERTVTAKGLYERVVVRSTAPHDLRVLFTLVVAPDSTPMSAVRASVTVGDRPTATAHDDGTYTWPFGREGEACLVAPGSFVQVTDRIHASWDLEVPARGEVSVQWRLLASEPSFPFSHDSADVEPRTGVEPLDLLVQTASRDLAALRMTGGGGAAFYGAGAPWFLTLFGRDSLLSARLSLPWSREVALGTLRALASRQGTTTDPATAEQPGKIPHEVRGEPLRLYGSGRQEGDHDIVLPPVYYGTIDATCLWVMLLGDLEAAGISDDDLAGFVLPLRAALGWLRDHGDADGDGFLEYADTGEGLSNQGWKDSADSIRWADGSLARGPIALCEAQGYAHEAALVGARLLDRLGDADEAAAWRDWAARLAERFRAQFWVSDDLGPYPAIALDADKRPVTGVASNMGHLLGTGILTTEEAAVVVARLMHPTLRSGFGIRTLSTDNAAYWPLGYHVGSIWTHDNGVILAGMRREGFLDEARLLAAELLRAAMGYSYRLPELYAGYGADETPTPLPFPAACHPQAWAAATAATIESVLRKA